jgi:hypothetical protein
MAKEMTIETVNEIQSAMSERAHAGFDDMTPITEKYEDLGYAPAEIAEVIEAGLKELAATYSEN